MGQPIPVEPFSPGEYIQDELDARGWTRLELANRLGKLRPHAPIAEVEGLLSGDLAVTPDLARRLAIVLGSESSTWLALQKSYDLAKGK